MAIRIMIVDDSEFMRELLKKILMSDFSIVGEAANGIEAVELFEKLKPDIVTMDLLMSRMDGIKATKYIIKRHPEAKIVICSSVGEEEKIKEALALGAKGYINKPFIGSKVIQEIKNVLAA